MADQAARTAWSTSAVDLVGTPVGRFRIQARLGAGGMGEVYLAEDTGLKRQVALKRITSRLRANAKSRQRLWREAECASRLNDPHVAAVYDVIEESNELFVVMEYIEGETLRRRLARPLTVDEFVGIAEQCASGLSAAHRAGLLHRDIKPENIMLTSSGQAKILDFGLARELPLGDDATQDTIDTTSLSGTLLYMAPEVLDQKDTDARADIFSLGIVFYEALSGQHPFQRASLLETCNAILREELPALSSRNAEVPTELQHIVHKMLAKDQGARYATANEICRDLEALDQELGLAGAQSRHSQRIYRTDTRRFSRRRLMLGVLASVLLTATAVGALTYRHFRAPLLNEHDSILRLLSLYAAQALDSAESKHRKERVLGEPAFASLAPEMLHQVTHLLLADRIVQLHEEVRDSKVSVVLDYFVLENRMVPKRVPGQFRYDAMILMQVVSVMGKYEVGGAVTLELLEGFLETSSHIEGTLGVLVSLSFQECTKTIEGILQFNQFAGLS